MHRFNLLATLAMLLGPLSAGFAHADEGQYESSTYYEAEPWYDVTEWFDGNDYRLTETGEAVLNDTDDEYGDDYDNPAYGYDDDYSPYYPSTTYDYGYDDRYDYDNWFYDYWDDGYAYYRDYDSDGVYEYSSTYYDFDGDGYYDAYTSYYDRDDDGWYEDVDYYTFNQAGEQNDSQDKQKAQRKSSKQFQVSGTVASVKKVNTRDAKHVLAKLESKDGKIACVDLGPTQQMSDFDLAEGDKIKARGPVVKVGDKRVLIARMAKIEGESVTPERKRQEVSGTIEKVRTFKSRGQQHLMAAVALENRDSRVLIDMGPKKSLDIDLGKGDKVTIEGAPVAAQNRRVLLAQKVTHDGETVSIDRREGDKNAGRSKKQQARASSSASQR